MIEDLVCKDKIKACAIIYNLDYTTDPDPGLLVERYRTPYVMDIDLRKLGPPLCNTTQLFLQFYGLNYEFVYVFNWNRGQNVFSEVMCGIDLHNSGKIIDVLIAAITNKDHIATKYGLK